MAQDMDVEEKLPNKGLYKITLFFLKLIPMLLAACALVNTVFSFYGVRAKEAVVVIGPTSSGKEFINTLCHEVYHVAVAIAEGLGVSLSGENPAYITGESMMELAQIVCKLGCQKCNRQNEIVFS